MDKSVGGKEDVVKQLDDPENDEQQLQNDSVDGKEFPHSTTGDDSEPTDVGVEEEEKDKSDVMTKSKEEDLKIMETEAEDPNNVINEEVKEAENPDNLSSEEVKEAENPDNLSSEGVKQAEHLISVKSEGDNEKHETSKLKTESEDLGDIKSKDENPNKIGSEANGGNAYEIREQYGNSIENIVEDQKQIDNEGPQNEPGVPDEVHQSKDEVMADLHQTDNEEKTSYLSGSNNMSASETAMAGGDAEMPEMKETKAEVNNTNQNVKEETVNVVKGRENQIVSADAVADGKAEACETPVTKCELGDTSVVNHQEPATPTPLVKCTTANGGNHSGETYRNFINEPKLPGDEDGTAEEQAAFMRELESFSRERGMEFKPPRFYGQQLNCLKLWRAVIRLGGYDRVTGSKLWRQVGESFHPPKTCTTVSWTFRIFYEKALLEYERYKTESGELSLPLAIADGSGVDIEGNGYQASGSGRARRDAASRAMQGWHAQRLFGSGEVGEQDKNINNIPKREKNLKSIGTLKHKRPNEVEHPVKSARTELPKQLVASVIDVGPPADWVKINVRETKDCFEVYALVPGLLREEVKVQSDPAGRLVITGIPEHPDNPWGITVFKKVVSLPGRIDPLQTSAVVSLHGRLFVRVPFEQSNV